MRKMCFQLTHYELESAIIDLMTAWSNGSPPRGSRSLAVHRRAAARRHSHLGAATRRPRRLA